jgi:hypothetical protein
LSASLGLAPDQIKASVLDYPSSNAFDAFI